MKLIPCFTIPDQNVIEGSKYFDATTLKIIPSTESLKAGHLKSHEFHREKEAEGGEDGSGAAMTKRIKRSPGQPEYASEYKWGRGKHSINVISKFNFFFCIFSRLLRLRIFHAKL